MSHDTLRAKLRDELDLVHPTDLVPHARRGALVVAAAEVDLLAAAVAIATDDAATVGRWIEDERLSKPSMADLATWCMDPDRRFRVVIVQPFVLVQQGD